MPGQVPPGVRSVIDTLYNAQGQGMTNRGRQKPLPRPLDPREPVQDIDQLLQLLMQLQGGGGR